VAVCSYEERDIPKSARFRWNPAAKQWWTDRLENAAMLAGYAAPNVRAELDAVRAEQRALKAENVQASVATEALIDVPAPAGRVYLPYQRAGIAYCLSKQGALLADDMGLGKTIQAIGVMNADASVKRTLIVCPNTLKVNWRSELHRWLVEKRSVGIAMAGGTFPSTDVVIINYDIVAKYRSAINRVQWDLLICDEAHALKNNRALRTKHILGGGKKGPDRIDAISARRKLFLTGTPILNRPAEMWTLLHSLDPKGIGGDFWRFHKRYCAARQTQWGWDMTGASNLDELQRVLRESVMIRRLKSEVLTDLPAKRRQIVEIGANGASATVEREMQAFQHADDKLAEMRARVALADAAEDEAAYKRAVSELRAAQGVVFAEMSKLRHATAVAKVPYVIEHLRDALEGGAKVVCFAHHLDVINALAAEFGSACVTLTGSTKLEDRQAAVDRFQSDPSCTLFLGNILAAGVGITLTASSHVVFVELDWRPAMVTQAEDRTHRIGQRDSVLVQHLVFDGSLDATMAQKIVAKQAIIDAALDVGMAAPEDEEAIVFDQLATLAHENAPLSAPEARPATSDIEPLSLTPQQVEAVLVALRLLAGMDTDGARVLNGVGFSKFDSAIGHDLAGRVTLSPKQATLGLKIARKYRRQISADLVTAMGG
jgi:SWI/SNF-related matrix-associated actin-dependent regulator 1 of chromatin subfamily A